MFRYSLAALALAAMALVSCVDAGGFKTKLNVGDKAPTWSNLPGVDGKNHSLADLKDKDFVVVAITCNHCPVAVAYESRMVEFAKKYAGPTSKVAFIAINVNTSDADKLEAMKTRAEQSGFNFPYLYDESQEIGKQLNATVTPEFYVYDKNRNVVYWGAMDDSQNASKVSQHYLANALDALLQGESVKTARTKAKGCGVQYNN
jgi:peroxiredoxin